MNDAPIRVGVLSLHSSKETKAILNAIDGLGHESVWLRRENAAVSIEDGTVTIEPSVDIVINRLLLSNTETPADYVGLAETFSRVHPMLNEPGAVLTAVHKFAAAVALADNGVRVPDALLALSSDRLNAGRERFGEFSVYKTAIGTHGGGTWKVGQAEQVSATVGSRHAFVQQLLERDVETHRDLRVYIVGGDCVGAMYRYAPEGDWRTNVALGGSVENATDELPDGVVATAKSAAAALGLDCAGVDLVEGHDGWYVLEVNPTAGFKGLYRATGRSPAPYIAKLAIERFGGEVDESTVEQLAETLDDSRPRSAPAPREAPEQTPVIGYTEEIVVTGTAGSTRAFAKSDTGATRTSIDTGLAAEVGAGPIKSMTRVRSGSRRRGKTRPVVDLVVGIGGSQHTVTASVEDRSHMDYPVLLGRDILKEYQVDVRRRADEPGVARGSADEDLEE